MFSVYWERVVKWLSTNENRNLTSSCLLITVIPSILVYKIEIAFELLKEIVSFVFYTVFATTKNYTLVHIMVTDDDGGGGAGDVEADEMR